MSSEEDGELTVTERVGVVVTLLNHGHSFTTFEVAKIAGLSYSGAWRMMDRLSRKLPLVLVNARWRMLEW